MELIYKGHPVQAGPSFGGAPLGSILTFMGTKAPKGYLVCDGALYNIASYPALAAFFQEQFGSAGYFGGDGETTFAVPDLRDQFLRGFHGSGATQYSGEIGKKQLGTQLPTYWGYVDGANTRLTIVGSAGNAPVNMDRDASESNLSSYRINAPAAVASGGQNDAIKMGVRPSNVAVLYCIKHSVDTIELSLDEYDTSDGWHVRKWSDGYLELSLLRSVHVAPGSFSASGNVYVSGSATFDYAPYPIPFLEIYGKTMTPVQGAGGFWCMPPGLVNPSPLTQADRIHLVRTTLPAADVDYTVSYQAAGRWK